jgi:hypothetical protein
VLRGGIRLEQFWVAWLTEYLDAHQQTNPSTSTSTSTSTSQGAPA